MSNFAPIAVFVFNRLEHTRRAIEALAQNPEFASSPLYVFCDGPRNEEEFTRVELVKEYVREIPHSSKVIVESSCNKGLANSIVSGIGRLCDEYGKVIVIEDDLVVSPVFLNYMNSALEYYVDSPQVMQISGHMFPVSLPGETDAVFLPFTTSWGWATWKRAWHYKEDVIAAEMQIKNRHWRFSFDIDGAYPYSRMLIDRLDCKNNSWAIWWYFHVFSHSGLTLYPRVTLVNNEGFDGSGTHCGVKVINNSNVGGVHIRNYPPIEVDVDAIRVVRRFLINEQSVMRQIYEYIWRLIYKRRTVANV